MKLVREKVREVEPKPEPKPVVVVHTVQPDVEKIRQDIRNELLERLRQEREEWTSKYDAELNQLKDVIHYNTMKILHEMASQLDELEKRLDCSDKY
jgi:glutamyl-tRNA reductase